MKPGTARAITPPFTIASPMGSPYSYLLDDGLDVKGLGFIEVLDGGGGGVPAVSGPGFVLLAGLLTAGGALALRGRLRRDAPPS